MKIEQNVPLHDKNWFQTGGPAQFYAEPTTPEEFCSALDFASAQGLPIEVLGHGANLIVSDEGFQGLIIKPNLTALSWNEETNRITAGAGLAIQDCIDWSLAHNKLGLEEFSGIPGTIGGAVYINLHYFQFFLSHFLVSGTIIHRTTGKIKTVPNEWFQFGYDKSTLQAEKEYFLLNATFQLQPATAIETAYAQGRRDEIIRQRNSRYPTEHTCGSFFRNFHEEEFSQAINAKKLKFVAYYLDKLGIKGELRYGTASVSYQHANMIVTEKNGRSQDIIMLARSMQERVFHAFGLIPHAECQLIGFKEYPLHQSLTKSHHEESVLSPPRRSS